jgi:hypothetical protein
MIKYLLIPFLLISASLTIASAQSAVEHMDYFSAKNEELSKNYMSYMSEVAHGERARKMEKRRMELINYLKETIREASKVKPYKNDVSLRNAYIECWNVLVSIFNEDYSKIVNMEEVAEQSYDEMEAYLLAQDKAGERLEEAQEKATVAYNAFAASNSITLTEGKTSKLSKKLKKVSAVNSYHKVLFLIHFKAQVQETHAIAAFNTGDINALEQRRESLLKYTNEGLEKLATLEPYEQDGSLINAMRKMLEFYKEEATTAFPIFSEFLMKKEEFEKIKKSYDAKGSGNTKDDVSSYNKVITDLNKLVVSYNTVSKNTNSKRNDLAKNWEITKKNFMDAHVPYK